MAWFLGSHLLLSVVALALSQASLLLGAPVEHLVSELPGQPPVGFRQYSGYITVDEAKGTNLFYYFVEAEANASSLPLALWLNGGPGCSSVGGGAFTELGPFYPKPNGGLRRNPYAWNKVANLLFLESPAGTGWSYTCNKRDGYTYDDWGVAKESLVFMRRWLQRFPEYGHRQLFLTGESYAGHYIPQLAWLMVKSKGFNLKGTLIGNPLLNYGIDTSATYSFLWSHGLISDETFQGVSHSCDFRYGYMGGESMVEDERRKKIEEKNGSSSNSSGKRKEAEDKQGGCTSFLGSAREEMGSYINIYDVTSNVCPPPIINQAILLHRLMGVVGENVQPDACIDHEITHYLNEPSVQKALNANLTSLQYPWEFCSRIVDYSASDQLTDMIPLLARLVKKGLPLWIFSGDQDSVVPLTGTRTQIAKLARRLQLNLKSPYRPWYAHGQVGGWCEVYGDDGKLSFATVRGASHMVPYAQPARALVLFTSFIYSRPLPCRS